MVGSVVLETGRRLDKSRIVGAIGALTVFQTGIVGVGLSGFYVQFFYGLIIIRSLVGHRRNEIQ